MPKSFGTTPLREDHNDKTDELGLSLEPVPDQETNRICWLFDQGPRRAPFRRNRLLRPFPCTADRMATLSELIDVVNAQPCLVAELEDMLDGTGQQKISYTPRSPFIQDNTVIHIDLTNYFIFISAVVTATDFGGYQRRSRLIVLPAHRLVVWRKTPRALRQPLGPMIEEFLPQQRRRIMDAIGAESRHGFAGSLAYSVAEPQPLPLYDPLSQVTSTLVRSIVEGAAAEDGEELHYGPVLIPSESVA